jgi:transcriptional regulator with XRE-family HTH domain
MKNEALPVKSTFLMHKMTEVVAKTGFTIHEMADKTGLSYGYMRSILNGTVIPNRDAMKRLCDGLGLDFIDLWRGTRTPYVQVNSREVKNPPEVIQAGAAAMAKIGAVAAEKLGTTMTPRDQEFMGERLRDMLVRVFDILPLTAKVDLLQHAWELSVGQQNDPQS